MPWFLPLLIAIAIQVVVYLLTPKPKQPKPAAVEQLDNPTASADREIPVVFGTVIVKELNFLWYGEKRKDVFEIDV